MVLKGMLKRQTFNKDLSLVLISLQNISGIVFLKKNSPNFPEMQQKEQKNRKINKLCFYLMPQRTLKCLWNVIHNSYFFHFIRKT